MSCTFFYSLLLRTIRFLFQLVASLLEFNLEMMQKTTTTFILLLLISSMGWAQKSESKKNS